jgi:hypothetical protein
MNDIFNFFGPQGTPTLLGLITALVIILIRSIVTKKENLQSDEINKGLFQNELKKMIATQESRKVDDFLLEESVFWELIDKTRLKSKNNFKNQCGLLKDYFEDLDPKDLLAFQSRLLLLFSKFNSNKLQAAFSIINYSIPFSDYQMFLEWMISKGELLSNNYSHNPELLENSDFTDVYNTLGISPYLGEIYYAKTGKLIPEIVDFEEKSVDDTEEIDPKKVADYFPRLWKKFIV